VGRPSRDNEAGSLRRMPKPPPCPSGDQILVTIDPCGD
jgi:hypothetical protein